VEAQSPRGTFFPIGPDWELVAEHVRIWFLHRFERLAYDRRFLARLTALDDHELMLLKLDLDCYDGLCMRYLQNPRRYRRPAPLPDYLKESRESWGEVAAWLREGAE
jgi:hypothetical protein